MQVAATGRKQAQQEESQQPQASEKQRILYSKQAIGVGIELISFLVLGRKYSLSDFTNVYHTLQQIHKKFEDPAKSGAVGAVGAVSAVGAVNAVSAAAASATATAGSASNSASTAAATASGVGKKSSSNSNNNNGASASKKTSANVLATPSSLSGMSGVSGVSGVSSGTGGQQQQLSNERSKIYQYEALQMIIRCFDFKNVTYYGIDSTGKLASQHFKKVNQQRTHVLFNVRSNGSASSSDSDHATTDDAETSMSDSDASTSVSVDNINIRTKSQSKANIIASNLAQNADDTIEKQKQKQKQKFAARHVDSFNLFADCERRNELYVFAFLRHHCGLEPNSRQKDKLGVYEEERKKRIEQHMERKKNEKEYLDRVEDIEERRQLMSVDVKHRIRVSSLDRRDVLLRVGAGDNNNVPMNRRKYANQRKNALNHLNGFLMDKNKKKKRKNDDDDDDDARPARRGVLASKYIKEKKKKERMVAPLSKDWFKNGTNVNAHATGYEENRELLGNETDAESEKKSNKDDVDDAKEEKEEKKREGSQSATSYQKMDDKFENEMDDDEIEQEIEKKKRQGSKNWVHSVYSLLVELLSIADLVCFCVCFVFALCMLCVCFESE